MVEQKADLKKTVGQALGLLWLFLGLQLSVSGSMSAISGFVIGAAGLNQALYSLCDALTLLAATALSGFVTVLVGSRFFGFHPFDLLKSGKLEGEWVGKGICMTYTASYAMSFIVAILNLFLAFLFGASAEAPTIGAYGWMDGVINFVSVVILAPLFEELIFRGMIFRTLARFNAGFAVVFSALVFALAHLNLGQAIPVFAMGIVFGFLYYRSGSLKVPVAVHMINNLIATLSGYTPALLYIIGVCILIAAVCGVYFIYKERHQYGGMFALCGQAHEEWSAAAHKVSFWLLIGAFVIFSAIDILATAL